MRIVLVVDDSASSADAVETVADRLWPSGTTVECFRLLHLSALSCISERHARISSKRK